MPLLRELLSILKYTLKNCPLKKKYAFYEQIANNIKIRWTEHLLQK